MIKICPFSCTYFAKSGRQSFLCAQFFSPKALCAYFWTAKNLCAYWPCAYKMSVALFPSIRVGFHFKIEGQYKRFDFYLGGVMHNRRLDFLKSILKTTSSMTSQTDQIQKQTLQTEPHLGVVVNRRGSWKTPTKNLWNPPQSTFWRNRVLCYFAPPCQALHGGIYVLRFQHGGRGAPMNEASTRWSTLPRSSRGSCLKPTRRPCRFNKGKLYTAPPSSFLFRFQHNTWSLHWIIAIEQ